MSVTDDDHPITPDPIAEHSRLSSSDAARAASQLSLMADPVRRRLIKALDATKELCVGDLTLDVSEASASYALPLLHTAGLLVTRKRGRAVHNRLADAFPAAQRDHCLRQLSAVTHIPDDFESHPTCDDGV